MLLCADVAARSLTFQVPLLSHLLIRQNTARNKSPRR